MNNLSFDSLLCSAKTHIPFLPEIYIGTLTKSCKQVHEEGVLSCHNPFLDQYINEAKGFSLSNKKIAGFDDSLPFYIPIPTKESLSLPLHNLSPYVGVHLQKVLFPRALKKNHGNTSFTDNTIPDYGFTKSPVFKDVKKILFYSGPDNLIEGLNRNKYSYPLYELIKKAGIDITTTPDFSINMGSCTLGHVLNFNRTIAVGEEFEKVEISVIPNMFAVNTFLLDMGFRYLKKNTQMKYISINCQCQRSKKDKQNLNMYIKELLENTNVHLLLHGYNFANLESLLNLKKYACRVHFADSVPFTLARNYRYQLFQKNTGQLKEIEEKDNSDIVRASMIRKTFQAREEFLKHHLYGATCPIHLFSSEFAIA